MAREALRKSSNIGSSSLILIFMILCLATFGLLSLSTARRDYTMAERNAAAVSGYYEADSRGVLFYQQMDQKVMEIYSQPGDWEDCVRKLEEELGDDYQRETKRIITEIPMERGQALHIELGIISGDKKPLDVLAWQVRNQEDYEIDNTIPLWTE